jgi:hypothetical protein
MRKKEILSRTLKLMTDSLDTFVKDYKIIVFTNFDTGVINKNIEYKEYYNNNPRIYTSGFLNLSLNKIYLYKDLYDLHKIDYIWIDLDTIVTYDISYINSIPNCFIENGGTCINNNILFNNNNTISVPRNRYIQGNFWKLNIMLYNELMKCFKELTKKKLILRYDLQDLFSYYIYIKKEGDTTDIFILGNTYLKNSLNGLAIWDIRGNTHATEDGLKNLRFENKILKSNLYPEKEIHIVSFTFGSLNRLWDKNIFTNFIKILLNGKIRIGVFGTCRIDNYNIEDLNQIRK